MNRSLRAGVWVLTTVAGEGKGEYRRKEEKGSTLMICEKPIKGTYYFIGLLKNTDIHTLLTYARI